MLEGIRLYNLFPRLAGPVEAWQEMLPRIAAMGFNAVYINPFHEVGFSGSLYAVKDHYRLDPSFRGPPRNKEATATDADLLAGFAAASFRHGLRPVMDLVINHTAKDSALARAHPDWFAREADGSLKSPSAMDPADASKVTVWGDLAEIAYGDDRTEAAIIDYFGEVATYYMRLGFRGFRCDAAYKVPARVWRALIGAARERAPDCLFCAETLGAPLDDVMQLRGAGFDYLFNSVKWWDFEGTWLLDQYEAFRRIAPSIAFPESHDTPRLVADLQAGGITDAGRIAAFYRLRYALAACFSAGVMMPLGFEYGWARPMDVVTSRPEPAEPARFDLSGEIAAINAMKRDLPALNVEGPQRLLSEPGDPLTILARRTEDGLHWAFTLINADESATNAIDVDTLLGAVDEGTLALEDVTPGDAVGSGDRAVIGFRLEVPPLGFRVVRGIASAAARPPVDDTAARVASATRPEMHPDWAPDARILIEDVYPELDGGRYPIKRVVGDPVVLWADIFRDGHDVIAAVIKYRNEITSVWREAPMRLFDNDRWTGRFVPDEVGRFRYTIEAWTDGFASWRQDAAKKRAAGTATALDFEEGHALATAAASRAAGSDALVLQHLLREIGTADEATRWEIMLSRLLTEAVGRNVVRSQPTRYRHELEVVVDRPIARTAAWYEMMPRSQGRTPGQSATFDDCVARLPEIGAMGFDVVYLPPIHPIGRVNRKGPDNSLVANPGDPGSPYAIGAAEGGHRAVHPELGGIEGFRRFVAATRELGMEVALDFATQAAPDHPWIAEHPAWFQFRADGTIKYAENPPKKYQDIVNPDFYNADRTALWDELRGIFLYWISEGVTIFRVDNPHTKPVPFWEWLIREVQSRHPGIVFLAEAFTRPKLLRVLAKAGFTQSYSYFTWRNTKAELTEYLTELTQGSSKEYLRPNFFTNTPDILPPFLQQGGRPAFRIRLVLAATLSSVYGIYNGFELCENTAVPGTEDYLHSEKYEWKVWDWDRPGHIKDDITRLNEIRRDHAALREFLNLRFCQASGEHVLAYIKATAARDDMVLVVVNLDWSTAQEATIELPLAELGLDRVATFDACELFTGVRQRWQGAAQTVRLDPHLNPAAIFHLTR
jgi:starch synthase (maltosyl-transferring)